MRRIIRGIEPETEHTVIHGKTTAPYQSPAARKNRPVFLLSLKNQLEFALTHFACSLCSTAPGASVDWTMVAGKTCALLPGMHAQSRKSAIPSPKRTGAGGKSEYF
jgi:hypothetical protein